MQSDYLGAFSLLLCSRVTFGFQEQDCRNGIPVILCTHRPLGKMSEGSMELTEQHDNDSVALEDTISLDALSTEELAYIAKNLKYSQLLAELLHGPDQAGEGALLGLVDSADHTSTRNAAGKGTDHTFQREREPSCGTEHSSTHSHRKRERMGHRDSSDSSSEDESHRPTTSHKRRKLEAGNKDLTSPFDPSKEKETEEFRF